MSSRCEPALKAWIALSNSASSCAGLCARMLGEQRSQPVDAKALVGARQLGDTVGVEQDQLVVNGRRLLGPLRIGERSEQRAAGRGLADLTGVGHDHRGRVPRRAEHDVALAELGAQRCAERVAGALSEEFVEPAEDRGGLRLHATGEPGTVPHQRGHRSCMHALAGDVADQCEPAVVGVEQLVEVTADVDSLSAIQPAGRARRCPSPGPRAARRAADFAAASRRRRTASCAAGRSRPQLPPVGQAARQARGPRRPGAGAIRRSRASSPRGSVQARDIGTIATERICSSRSNCSCWASTAARCSCSSEIAG